MKREKLISKLKNAPNLPIWYMNIPITSHMEDNDDMTVFGEELYSEQLNNDDFVEMLEETNMSFVAFDIKIDEYSCNRYVVKNIIVSKKRITLT